MSIRHIKKISEPPQIDIIIPAAGLGKRMKSHGPKPLIPIHRSSIIERQLKSIKKYLPTANIILVAGFDAVKLMNHTPDYLVKIENERFETTNVVRSIGMGLRACSHDVMIMYGDLVFNDLALQTINLNRSSLLVGPTIMGDKEVGCIVTKDKVENLMYDLPNKWGQISFFKGRELKLLKEICWTPHNFNMFGFEAINQIINNGGKFTSCSDPGVTILDIDTNKDLEKALTLV